MLNEGNVAGSAFFRKNESPPVSLSADGQTASHGNNILICSRDSDTQVLLKTILDLWEIPSQISDCAEQTDSLITEFNPNLILLDSFLPFVTHLENIRQIRRRKISRNIPIVVISGFSQTKFKNMSLAAGASDFLVKPLDFDLLENYLKRFIRLPDKKPL